MLQAARSELLEIRKSRKAKDDKPTNVKFNRKKSFWRRCAFSLMKKIMCKCLPETILWDSKVVKKKSCHTVTSHVECEQKALQRMVQMASFYCWTVLEKGDFHCRNSGCDRQGPERHMYGVAKRQRNIQSTWLGGHQRRSWPKMQNSHCDGLVMRNFQ